MAVDGAIGDGEPVAPDAVDELRAGEDATRRAEQAREQIELDARELDRLPSTNARRVASSTASGQLTPEAARGADARRRRGARAPEHGAHAGHDLARREGLGDVVVGARLERGDAIGLARRGSTG